MAPARKKQKLLDGEAAAMITGEDAGTVINTKSDEKPHEGRLEQRRSLFVRSLPATTTTETLIDLFSESYPIKHATAVIDPATKQCKGYGFVTFADAEDAQRAQKEFNGHTFEGRKLRIEIAEPRHRDAERVQNTGAGEVHQSKKQQQRDAPQPSRLIIRNLPWTLKTSDQLAKLFMSYGKVKQAYIPKKGHGLSAGFGFVVLRGRKNAEKALEGVNGKEVDGRTLAVDWAVSKEVYEDLMKEESSQAGDAALDKQAVELDDDEEAKVSNDAGDALDDSHDGSVADDAESSDGSDENDEDAEIDVENGEVDDKSTEEDRSATLFIRNLPFTCTDDDLEDHFSQFGSTRYARVVVDLSTDRSKGTAFVAFYDKTDADACLRGAPRRPRPSTTNDAKDSNPGLAVQSILQNEESDPSGQYTIDGRVLQLSRAVNRTEANRLTEEGTAHRHKRDRDKRRLYLLAEGTLSSKSKLWEKLSPSERTMREASAKQRKALIESNPSLHLSLTRLSIRNIPRSVSSKELKAYARQAVVGFASDVKAGLREKLSKEELARGGEEMLLAEKARKKSGAGIVKQAKVVFEGATGSKTSEDSGAGRSRGYGFIEYYTHRNALMGLRWLNGNAVASQMKGGEKGKISRDEVQDRKKRLIVEFAIENAQVVLRRKDKEQKARDRSHAVQQGMVDNEQVNGTANCDTEKQIDSRKRKRSSIQDLKSDSGSRKKLPKSRTTAEDAKDRPKKPIDEKLAQRNRIIGRKRAARRARQGAQ